MQTITQQTTENKKPVYKKWWFWVGSAILFFMLLGIFSEDEKPQITSQIDNVIDTETRSTEEPLPKETSARKWACGDPITFIYSGSNITYGTVISANSKCWLDRNLGASRAAQSFNDSQAYGDLFQWGRGDWRPD